MSLECVIFDRKCIECGECDICDIDKNRKCNNCGRCIDENDEFRSIKIDEFLEKHKDKKI